MSLSLYKFHSDPESLVGFEQLDTNPNLLDAAIGFYDVSSEKVVELAAQYLENRNILPIFGTYNYVIAEWDSIDNFLIDMHGKSGPYNIMTVYRDNGQRSSDLYPSIDQFTFFDIFTPFEKKEIEKVIDYLQRKHGLQDRKKWKEFLYKLENSDIHNAIIESILHGYDVGYMMEFEDQIDRIVSEFEIGSLGKLGYNGDHILDATTCRYIVSLGNILRYYRDFSSGGEGWLDTFYEAFLDIKQRTKAEEITTYSAQLSSAHHDALYANDHEAASNRLRELLATIIG